MTAKNANDLIATADETHIFDRQKRVGKPHRMRDFRKPCFAPTMPSKAACREHGANR
jgi:hypothetical protein